MEEWRDIPGYEGLYQASNFGEIRTVEGKTTSSARYKTRRWKSRVMKGRGCNLRTGKRVGLWKDGKCRDFLVARLVAETFLGTPKDGDTVNHIDGNRLNNNVENLEWLSLGDNIRHGFRTGLYAKTQKRVALIRGDRRIEFQSMAEASRFLGRQSKYVGDCVAHSGRAFASDGTEYEVATIGAVVASDRA